MYLAFLFSVIVVLLNLLIAQMSDTYTKVQEDVEGTFAIARARIISRLQKGKWLFCNMCKGSQDKQNEEAENRVSAWYCTVWICIM